MNAITDVMQWARLTQRHILFYPCVLAVASAASVAYFSCVCYVFYCFRCVRYVGWKLRFRLRKLEMSHIRSGKTSDWSNEWNSAQGVQLAESARWTWLRCGETGSCWCCTDDVTAAAAGSVVLDAELGRESGQHCDVSTCCHAGQHQTNHAHPHLRHAPRVLRHKSTYVQSDVTELSWHV